MSLRDPPYEPPSVSELQEFLLVDRRPTGHVNQVWPNLFIGNEVTARDKDALRSLGITHIVNAAHRPPNPGPGTFFCVNTGPRFYRDMTVDYYGVEANDAIEFMLSPFFYPTARYIRAALATGGRVFVHCLMGVSRSATLVLAFLMIVEGLRLQEALAAVRPHRDICPNSGFLQQLRSLDKSLERERRRRRQAQTLGHSQEEATPPLTELRQILWTDRKPVGPVNQVWPNLYIGDESVARDKTTLTSLGVTHILNAAAGRHRINTGQEFYNDLDMEYHSVEAADHPEFNLRPFFSPAATVYRQSSEEKWEGVCALCHGHQPIWSAGSCVSADLPGPDVGRGHHRRASEPRHRTQLWVSGAAEAAGAEPRSTEQTDHRGGPRRR